MSNLLYFNQQTTVVLTFYTNSLFGRRVVCVGGVQGSFFEKLPQEQSLLLRIDAAKQRSPPEFSPNPLT